MKEKCSPLSPRSLTQPVGFDQINFSKEDQQCKNDSRDLLSSKNCEIVGKKEIYEGSDTEETLEFKFSVSRLPRWARARVTSSGAVPREVGSTSPQVHFVVLIPRKCLNNESFHINAISENRVLQKFLCIM